MDKAKKSAAPSSNDVAVTHKTHTVPLKVSLIEDENCEEIEILGFDLTPTYELVMRVRTPKLTDGKMDINKDV